MAAVPPDARPHASSPRASSSSRVSRSTAALELVRPSRMAPTPEEVPVQVELSTETKKRTREEDEEDGNEREERLRGRITAFASIPGTAKAAATTAAGTAAGAASKEDSDVTAYVSGTSPPRPWVRQQVGHLLARVIEQGDQDARSSTCMPMVATAAMPSPIWSSSIGNESHVPRAMQGGQRCKKRKSLSTRINIDLNSDLEEVTQLEELNAETSSSRAMQDGQRCKKRKTPCSNIFMLRSPLSRMILSPIPGTSCTPSPRTGSPFPCHRTSPSARTCESRRVLTAIDFNILDLGFFSSIQSLQYKTSAKTTAELVGAVDEAFQDYSTWKADRIFLTLHGCLKEVMKIDCGNAYDVPHIRKEMLEREGRLPVQLDCEPALVQKAMDKLNE